MVVRVLSSEYIFIQIMQIYTGHTPTWYLQIIWYWTFVNGKMSVLKYMYPPSPILLVNKWPKVQGSVTKVSYWQPKYKTYMRKLLFSHHYSNYVGVAYLVVGIPSHWWVISYTRTHTNMIIHKINILWAIIMRNVLRIFYWTSSVPVCILKIPCLLLPLLHGLVSHTLLPSMNGPVPMYFILHPTNSCGLGITGSMAYIQRCRGKGRGSKKGGGNRGDWTWLRSGRRRRRWRRNRMWRT